VRLVVVTQQVDPAHPALAATVPKLRALCARADEVVVLSLGAVPAGLPENCRVKTFGARTRLGRGLRFAAALLPELLRRPRPGGVLAHMCPVYAVLAAPVARPLGVPVVLWYTHWRSTATLRLAVRMSSRVISVDRRSVPLVSAKVRGIGHGIDLAEFPCEGPRGRAGTLRALALGRTSAAKGLPDVVRAVGLARAAGVDVSLDVRGPSLTSEERAHRLELERLVVELRLTECVTIGDSVPREQVPALLAAADVLVNNMRAGAPDKVVYEAGAACLPVLASNPVFDELLGGLELPLGFERGRPEELAERLAALAALSPERRAGLGAALRERVAAGHSVESWADGVLAALRG